MKTKQINPFAHGGTNENLKPFQEGVRRGKAIAEGLRALAARQGIKFREPLQIDANGEFGLAVSNGTEQDGKQDVCGRFGKHIADLLNSSGGARTGLSPTRYMLPENGWCRLSHFAAQWICEQEENK